MTTEINITAQTIAKEINEASKIIREACAAIQAAQSRNDKQAEAKAKRYRRKGERKLEAAEAKIRNNA